MHTWGAIKKRSQEQIYKTNTKMKQRGNAITATTLKSFESWKNDKYMCYKSNIAKHFDRIQKLFKIMMAPIIFSSTVDVLCIETHLVPIILYE